MGRQEYHTITYKYSDRRNRTAKINQTALIYTTIIELFLIFGLFVQVVQAFVTPSTSSYGKLGVIPILVLLCGIIVNWICYARNKQGEMLKYIMFASYLIGYGYLMVTGVSILVTFYVFPVSVTTILYYDKKFEKISFGIILAFMAIRTVKWGMSGYLFSTPDGSALLGLVIGYILLFGIHVIANLAEQFDGDAVGKLKEEQGVQGNMLENILTISNDVKEGIGQADELVGSLKDASAAVNSAIQEITLSTNETAENIREQREMTNEINQAIRETADNAREMVEAARSSAEIVEENMKVINQIRASAESIGETNALAAGSMTELQEKAKEVQQITEVIFSVSSQTNLLALNASIESARAGEAGRGFAVVAEQIRALAEETRKSTEKISGIIEELNQNAQSAANIVQSSIDAMSQQNVMIESTSESFGEVRGQIDMLASRTADISQKIEQLVQSNNTIIDNIDHLSSASDRVSSNAEEATARGVRNQEEA